MSHEPLDERTVPSGDGQGGAVERALSLLDVAQGLPGAGRAEAFERFHDALAQALDEEPGD